MMTQSVSISLSEELPENNATTLTPSHTCREVHNAYMSHIAQQTGIRVADFLAWYADQVAICDIFGQDLDPLKLFWLWMQSCQRRFPHLHDLASTREFVDSAPATEDQSELPLGPPTTTSPVADDDDDTDMRKKDARMRAVAAQWAALLVESGLEPTVALQYSWEQLSTLSMTVAEANLTLPLDTAFQLVLRAKKDMDCPLVADVLKHPFDTQFALARAAPNPPVAALRVHMADKLTSNATLSAFHQMLLKTTAGDVGDSTAEGDTHHTLWYHECSMENAALILDGDVATRAAYAPTQVRGDFSMGSAVYLYESFDFGIEWGKKHTFPTGMFAVLIFRHPPHPTQTDPWLVFSNSDDEQWQQLVRCCRCKPSPKELRQIVSTTHTAVLGPIAHLTYRDVSLVAEGRHQISPMLSHLDTDSGHPEMQLALVKEEAFDLFDSLLVGVVFFG